MATKNDITGDSLVSRTSEAYRNNYDAIFGKKGKKDEQRKGRNDEQLENGSGSTEGVDTEADYPHDRLPADSNH